MNKNELLINMLPIETDRLIIRKTSIKDVDMLLKMDKQEETQKFLGGIKSKTKEERIKFLKSKKTSLTVCLKDETPIGITGLKVLEEKNCGSIGYIFDYDYCNKGYCTEACKKLIDIGFNELNLDYIIADTVEGNNSSIRVLEKLGFKYKSSEIKDGVDFLNYILYKGE